MLCSQGLRSAVNLFLLQKTRFHGLNCNREINIICTCNKDTGETGKKAREKMLKFSVLCLECTVVNYLIFIYLETFLSKMIEHFFLFFLFENVAESLLIGSEGSGGAGLEFRGTWSQSLGLYQIKFSWLQLPHLWNEWLPGCLRCPRFLTVVISVLGKQGKNMVEIKCYYKITMFREIQSSY